MGAKYSLPEFVYDATIVSEGQKDQAKEMVKELKEKMLLISERNKLNSQNVFIPFYESLEKSFPAEKASDMTSANRLFSFTKEFVSLSGFGMFVIIIVFAVIYCVSIIGLFCLL
jgi:hypothetical protein